MTTFRSLTFLRPKPKIVLRDFLSPEVAEVKSTTEVSMWLDRLFRRVLPFANLFVSKTKSSIIMRNTSRQTMRKIKKMTKAPRENETEGQRQRQNVGISNRGTENFGAINLV